MNSSTVTGLAQAGRRRPWAPAVLVVALASAACTAGESGLVSGAPVRPTQPPATAVAPPAAEAATPTSLAAELASIEVSIRSPAAAEGNIGDLGRRQQGLYRVLADHPEWQPDVARLAPTEVRAAVEANAAAAMELRGLAEPKAELPRWTIVAPPPVPTLVAAYKEAGTTIGVPWEYLAAIHLVETRMGRIRGDSSAGAQGPMQFLPTTWAIYGEGGDINSDRDAIFAAARLLKSRGAPADMARALFAYNNSTRYVRAITAYAEVIGADERAYAAYHAWQVYYGDRLLPEGFTNP